MKFSSPNTPPTSGGASIALDAVLVLGESRAASPGSDEDASLIALIDGRRTVAEILRVSRLSGSVAMRRLRSLSERRIIRTVATRLSAGPTPRIQNPRMGVTQDLSAAAEAFSSFVSTPKRNDGARPSSPPAPPRPTQPRPRGTPAQGSLAPPASVVVVDSDVADFHRLPATPQPQPVPAPPRRPPAPAPRENALVAIERHRPTAIIERPTARRSDDYVSLNGFASKMHDLWFRIARGGWATLVLIPAHAAGSALSVAHGLTEVGAAYTGRPIALLSAEGRELEPKENWIFPRKPGAGEADRFARVIVLEPLSSNPRGIAVAQAADAVLLVAETGVADVAGARRVVEKVGRHRFLGCVMLTSN